MELSSSRECLIKAINLKETERIPCCFMSFSALRNRFNEDRCAALIEESKMGLDPMMFIPQASRKERPQHPELRGLPVHFHPDVKTEHWISNSNGKSILNKRYTTPGGILETAVNLSADWPHGSQIPFIDDYQVPRTLKPLVTKSKDLEIVNKYFLLPPDDRDNKAFKKECREAKEFISIHSALLAGGWGAGLDMAFWLCGMQNLMIKLMEDPDFVKELLIIIHEWNKKRMVTVLSEGVDIYIRRAWYEGCDFVTPEFYNEAILPLLKAETELAHKHGARFGYICSSGHIPMLDAYLESGIDVLIGIDPVQGTHTDMEVLKKRIGHRICIWGGVSGAITVERGSEKEIRDAVRKAIDTLGPNGFILSPVDNITIDEPLTWKNIGIFIDEWQKCTIKS
jgi:uroporphyrinogen-III decarboxylase